MQLADRTAQQVVLLLPHPSKAMAVEAAAKLPLTHQVKRLSIAADVGLVDGYAFRA